jgi:glutathione S-transferase
MAVELYSWPHSSGSQIHWALEELGIPYKYNELDPKKKEQLDSAYLAINPHGKVPALVDGDQRFFESSAILLHLGFKYGVDKGLWPAPGSQDRADALCWTVWSASELSSFMLQTMYHGMDTPVSFQPKDRSAAAAGYARSQLDRCLGALETRLADREYLLGGSFSFADLACSAVLSFGASMGLSLADQPRSKAWCDRCTARPARSRAR